MCIDWRSKRRHHSKVCFSRFRKYIAKNPCRKLKRWRSMQRAMIIISKNEYGIGCQIKGLFWERRHIDNTRMVISNGKA